MKRCVSLASLLAPCLALLFSGHPSEAQTASLVADLSSRAFSPGPSSQPTGLFTFRGRLFFSAEQPGSGRELWVSDGEDRGTRQVADFCPGECGSDPLILGATATAILGHTRYREGFFDVLRLWRSDGTRSGTYLLPSAEDPVTLPDPIDFEDVASAVLGDVLFFYGCNDGQGCGLWRSDGTAAGTRVAQSFDSGASNLIAAGKRLFYFQDEALWVSDGSARGTRRVRDQIFGGRVAAGLNDKLVFLEGDQNHAQQLWVSDGTSAGTLALTRFAAPDPFAQTLFLKALGGKVYFVADDVLHGAELWATDGTPTGTRPVTEFGFHNPFNWDGTPFLESGLRAESLELLGNRIVFWATDGLHGPQPWSTTGTPASTTPLCPSCSLLNDGVTLVKVGARILFSGRDAAHGAELWATDGTPQGTALLKEICPGTCDGTGSPPEPLLGAAFFAAFDGRASSLWRTDGTAGGTRRFAAPVPHTGSFFQIGGDVAALGSTVYYAGRGLNDDYGVELWATNGTPAGTRPVTDIARGNDSTGFEAIAVTGRNLLFSSCGQSSGKRFWYTQGDPESTIGSGNAVGCNGNDPLRGASAGGGMLFPLADGLGQRDQLWRMDTVGALTQLTQMPKFFHIDDFAVLGGRFLFSVRDSSVQSITRNEIWGSDGTVQGTAKIVSLPAAISNPSHFTVVGSEIWFSVTDAGEDFGSELWRTDGTAAGTRQAVDFGTGQIYSDPDVTQVGSVYFFVGVDADSQRQIWRSDGTPAGSAMVRDLDPDPDDFTDALPADLTAFQGALYFTAKLAESRSGLWRTDGTEEGTELLRDFVDPGGVDDVYGELPMPTPFDLQVVGPWLVFAAADVEGRQLWRSDGTAAGTTLLRALRLTDKLDLRAGASFFQAAAGRLFFSADDGVHGEELWQTDGTPAGTRLVQDLAPEGAASYPDDLTLAEDRLFFSADDGITGRELWVLPLTGAPCVASAGTLCLAGGRFEVKASWRDFAGHSGNGHAVPLSGDTGTFWFFDAANVETVVKVLDGRGANGHFWFFFGALSNVEYTLTVTDTQTGAARRYFNPKGVFASVGDTEGFGPLGAFAQRAIAAAGPPPLVEERLVAAAATGTCVPAAGRLCLNGGRFAVEAAWKDFSNHTGTGTAVPLSGDTGYFWFFEAANVEAVVKVLDGTPVNGHFWLFYGALSNVEYTLTVTDTTTGKVKTYKNPKGRFASVGDTVAF